MPPCLKSLILPLLYPLITLPVGAQTERIWLAEDGIAVVEVEHCVEVPENSKWEFKTDYAGYSGTGYMRFTGSSEYPEEWRNYANEARDRVLSFKVKVDRPGRYWVKVRNYHLREDGDNDVWVSVNFSRWVKTYDWDARKWTYDERGNWERYNLAADTVHTVEIAGRSNGFMADRIVLFHSDYAPADFEDVTDTVWMETAESASTVPFDTWIASHEVDDPSLEGDPDGDGLSNGFEAVFGTDPGVPNEGHGPLQTDPLTRSLSFQHPHNRTMPHDLELGYHWSTDLSQWQESGSPPGGPAITLSSDTVDAVTTVTATTDQAVPMLFLKPTLSRSDSANVTP